MADITALVYPGETLRQRWRDGVKHNTFAHSAHTHSLTRSLTHSHIVADTDKVTLLLILLLSDGHKAVALVHIVFSECRMQYSLNL